MVTVLPALSLDCLTLTDSSPAELISSAATAGFDLVSLWINAPAAYPRMLLEPGTERQCADLLRNSGVGVHVLEVLDLSSETAILNYRPALEMGARLGGKAASAYNGGNPDRSHVVDLLALFVEVVGEFGLEPLLEPVAMARTRTLAEAASLIADAGGGAGILFDSWHLVRSGGGPAELAAIDPSLIRYVQLNDGILRSDPEGWVAEAMGERLYPGEGEFPLADLLRLLPEVVPWAIESPSVLRAGAGIDAAAQAREAIACLRRSMASTLGEGG